MKRLQLGCLSVGALIACAVVWVFVGMYYWPRVDPLPPDIPALVVVLSSGVTPDSQLDGAARERLRDGITMASESGAGLVTTRTIAGPNGPTSDYAQRRIVERTELAQRWTMLEPIVRSTWDEADATRSAFPRVSRIVVLTSRFHTRRACAIFENAGFLVTCRAAAQRPRSTSGQIYDYLYERLALWKYQYRARFGPSGHRLKPDVTP